MEKKKQSIFRRIIKHNITIALIIGLGISMLIYCASVILTETEKMSPKCGEFVQGFDNIAYDCCADCQKLDKEYFRHEAEYSLLSRDEFNCYCVDKEKQVEQLW